MVRWWYALGTLLVLSRCVSGMLVVRSLYGTVTIRYFNFFLTDTVYTCTFCMHEYIVLI